MLIGEIITRLQHVQPITWSMFARLGNSVQLKHSVVIRSAFSVIRFLKCMQQTACFCVHFSFLDYLYNSKIEIEGWTLKRPHILLISDTSFILLSPQKNHANSLLILPGILNGYKEVCLVWLVGGKCGHAPNNPRFESSTRIRVPISS